MHETSTIASVVTLTENAAQQIQSLRANDPLNAGKSLRLFVEAGGCSGMQYGMVFDEARENDAATDWHGIPIVVDTVSLNYLRGAVVDYVDSLTGGGFKITNPNARQSCGCGKSFEA